MDERADADGVVVTRVDKARKTVTIVFPKGFVAADTERVNRIVVAMIAARKEWGAKGYGVRYATR
jgi:hypothetical protein